MTDLRLITGFLASVFDTYIFYDFCKDIYDIRFGKRKRILILLLCPILTFLVNRSQNPALNMCLVSCIYLLVNILQYKAPLKVQLYYLILFYVIDVGVESGTAFACTIRYGEYIAAYNNQFSCFLIIIIGKICTFIILRFIKVYFINLGHYVDAKLFREIIILPIACLFIYLGLLYSRINSGVLSIPKVTLVLGCYLLLFANAFVFCLLGKVSQMTYHSKELELINMKNNMENFHYEKLEKINYEHMQYIHNMQHYLKTIGGLALKAENKEVINVLREMEVEINNIDEHIYCNHSILNALLCERESEAKKRHIKYDVYVEPSIYINFVKDFDLIAMIGNLIDNAIEATFQCNDNKYINIQIFATEGNFIMFRIENPYQVKPIKNGESFISTKKDKYLHGIGVANVKKLAEKYGGILYSEIEEDVFISSLLLPHKKNLENNYI